jgi:hypothetical protein
VEAGFPIRTNQAQKFALNACRDSRCAKERKGSKDFVDVPAGTAAHRHTLSVVDDSSP